MVNERRGLVDPDGIGDGLRRWGTPDETFGVCSVGDIESGLAGLVDARNQTVVDAGGCHHADAGVAVLVVVPGEEVVAKPTSLPSVPIMGGTLAGLRLSLLGEKDFST